MKKAQSTVEAMIILAVLLIFFTSIFTYSNSIEKDVWRNSESIYARDLCDNVGWSINQVYQAGEGTMSFVYLPEKLPGNVNYNITIYPEPQIIEIRWLTKRYFTTLLTSNVSTSIPLQPGRLNITNNGGIILEQ